ncbi:hypothetical protein BTO20_19445 [Mycobacterium dioxanotrophicus]|uniref:Uncharacterized protein n=1 Tax=Mycobacterium dioxanotrophicus TaxID=482462 RepID=A0A1Y0C5H7_9MYCO|nr:hypothetical protein [Mycobacterium dioxanotrophicus]ART70449.1 hypothetical protein BTO20_19445 [Mycobacterium dioxanotrophicus]
MGSTNFEQLRIDVLNAAREGRATYLPAGARDNHTAEVYIDGQLVGQASTVAHFVREDPESTTRFGERKLLPGYDHQIPERLR